MIEYYDLPLSSRKAKQRPKNDHSSLYGNLDRHNPDFRCVHCHNYVSAAVLFAGVQNRNHCPYCLWSRHMDLYEAGDRLAACKSPMRPLGLTLKRNQKKYAREDQGELMLVHQCSDCSRLSINRIAADDDADRILSIFEGSLALSRGLQAQIKSLGIRLLSETGREVVLARLFGQPLPI